MASRDLVIGIGNPLRGDDGVGWWLVEELGPPHQAVHQLTPECAALLVDVERVLFVDAWCAEPLPSVPVLTELLPADYGLTAAEGSAFSHHLSPGVLLAISQHLYGRSPQAWQLLVPAAQFGHGEALSPQLRALLPQARQLLQDWLQESLCTS
jgi:hydrogenase maturation protease